MGNHAQRIMKFAVLYLLAYTFLLRVPSEALPVSIGTAGGSAEAPAVLYKDGQALVLELQRRKNRPLGSTLRRRCWCETSPRTCPFHVLGRLVDQAPRGSMPWRRVTPSRARQVLRFMLQEINVPKARMYRTHDLRRGHALDLQLSGYELCY